MSDKQIIGTIHEDPESYGLNGTYYATVMFLTGLDRGRSGELLRGFNEWLVVRRDECNKFYWARLVLLDLFPDIPFGDWKEPDHLTPEQNREAVVQLCSLLLEFLEERDKPGELELVFERFEALHGSHSSP
ncbi:hypothetical protein AB0D49_12350 [Streptomyces sp. NPDC048290]|uniref:hypothetical protein n=1 Tax=Streptomyces sp. NPDC048290 TaxID=3155811 RepID=UPI00342758EC